MSRLDLVSNKREAEQNKSHNQEGEVHKFEIDRVHADTFLSHKSCHEAVRTSGNTLTFVHE
jgi:hypothetical protein